MNEETIKKINALKEAIESALNEQYLPNGIQLELPLRFYPKKPFLNTQFDAVVYFFQLMDTGMIGDLLSDELTYQDFPKHIFLSKLEDAFMEFEAAGNTYLEATEGFCEHLHCHYLNKGFRFTGNKSGHYMDIVFLQHNGIIDDIFECVSFCTNKEQAPIEKRIEIDRGN